MRLSPPRSAVQRWKALAEGGQKHGSQKDGYLHVRVAGLAPAYRLLEVAGLINGARGWFRTIYETASNTMTAWFTWLSEESP